MLNHDDKYPAPKLQDPVHTNEQSGPANSLTRSLARSLMSAHNQLDLKICCDYI